MGRLILEIPAVDEKKYKCLREQAKVADTMKVIENKWQWSRYNVTEYNRWTKIVQQKSNL